MKVGDLCTREAVTVNASAQVRDAARLMCEERIGAVVVTATPDEAPVAIGILTDRDIVRAQLDHATDSGQLRVGDIMTGDPLVLNEETSPEEAIHRLRNRHVRRAPVISSTGELVGVLSLDDLLAHLARNLRGLARAADVRSRAPRQGRDGRRKKKPGLR
jgi:CBS domain-containing protein